MNFKTEVPPTAGLPPFWRDLFLPNKAKLIVEAKRLFNLPFFQVECSGTAAFIIILTALKQLSPHRKEVIIPAYTCPLMVLAIQQCDLRVTLCDLGENTFDFDFQQLPQLTSDNTLAIVATHLGGRVADVVQAKKLAKNCGAFVVEDAAQALGADVGKIGDVTFFSLAVGKGLSLFEGGLIASENKALQTHIQEASQRLSPFKFFWEMRRCIEFIGYTACYHPKGLHYVYGQPRRNALKRSDLISAVGDDFHLPIPIHKVSAWRQNAGVNAIRRLPDFLSQTREQALKRCERLSSLSGVHIVADSISNHQGVWPFIMLLMPTSTVRDRVLAELWESPLGVSRLFIHSLPDYRYLDEYVPRADRPNARDFANRMLTISNSLWLDDAQFEQIFQCIQSIIQQK